MEEGQAPTHLVYMSISVMLRGMCLIHCSGGNAGEERGAAGGDEGVAGANASCLHVSVNILLLETEKKNVTQSSFNNIK